jgi:hypothetical protein
MTVPIRDMTPFDRLSASTKPKPVPWAVDERLLKPENLSEFSTKKEGDRPSSQRPTETRIDLDGEKDNCRRGRNGQKSTHASGL